MEQKQEIEKEDIKNFLLEDNEKRKPFKDCINIKKDGTDHFAFFCPNCYKVMKIKRTQKIKVCGDWCSYFWLKCSNTNCKFEGHKKIYWNDDGRYMK